MSGTRSPSRTAPATDELKPVLLLAAHGETGGALENAVLGKVATGTADRLQGVTVVKGVLNGSPSVEDAVAPFADRRIMVHPFFMSDGYFVSRVLPERLERAGVSDLRVLTPLGMLGALPPLVAVAIAARHPQRLMVVGHGSAKGDRSRLATEAFAAALSALLADLPTRCAYLEEEPFFADAAHQLQAGDVVVSYFAGDGSHARDDVPRMLEAAGKSDIPVIGPVGDLDGVDSVIVADVCAALAD